MSKLNSLEDIKPISLKFSMISEYVRIMSTTLSQESEEKFLEAVEEEIKSSDTKKLSIKKEPLIAIADLGAIDLAFPENKDVDPDFEGFTGFPKSYTSLSGKERLILFYAENFRQKFQINYPKRKPLVLAVKNECGVQKFVSTTIRPTAFHIPALIGSIDEISKFVSDFIVYEPLENPISLPQRLISPDTLLRRRKGNSFEMSTLLCSMLTGAGFATLVCSGYATLETTQNDQSHVECPFIPSSSSLEIEAEAAADRTHLSSAEAATATPNELKKYALKEPPDLRSQFDLEMERKIAQRKSHRMEKQREQKRLQKESLYKKPEDEFKNRRIHSWVLVIEDAPWCHRPKDGKKRIPQNRSDLKAFFIEPSTGFRHETDSGNYLRIDSIWNQYNYFVNRQESSTKNGLADTRWDLSDPQDWEHFLPNEPYELFAEKIKSVEDQEAKEISGKQLDLIPSWVENLQIGLKDFEERYPDREKSIRYKKALYQRYSPYHNTDGMSIRLTIFEENNCEIATIRWEWYENREDLLFLIKVDCKENIIEESFHKGREDRLKYYEHSSLPHQPKIFHFYYSSRLDALRLLEVSKEKISLHFDKRDDLRQYLDFQTDIEAGKKLLLQIIEKSHPNPKLLENASIAVRRYRLFENKILLQYHYAEDAITSSTREFIKPPTPDYGHEILFDPKATKGYKANPLDPDPKNVELYQLLLFELDHEEQLKHEFEKRCNEIDAILTRRKFEMLEPKLKISIYDPLRNGAARKLKLEQYAEEQKQLKFIAMHDADFLAPFLVSYEGRALNYDESVAVFKACLSSVKNRYVKTLSELQRRYEILNTEANSLKKFLGKFQNQFNSYEKEEFVKKSKDIELNKRTIQYRLIQTHKVAQEKYDKVKESLLKDKRLNLRNKDPTLLS